jgi:hypothetical protein
LENIMTSETPVPNVSIIPATAESLARLRGLPAIALEWLPGVPFTAYCVQGALGHYPSNMLGGFVMELYNLEGKLRNAGADYAVHGVLVGPGIMDNPLGLDQVTLFGLDVYDATEQRWLDWTIALVALKHLGIEPVPTIKTWWSFNATLDQLYSLAARQYANSKPSHGLLVRPLRHEQRDPFYVSVENKGDM